VSRMDAANNPAYSMYLRTPRTAGAPDCMRSMKLTVGLMAKD
jgi:hypothetical protein